MASCMCRKFQILNDAPNDVCAELLQMCQPPSDGIPAYEFSLAATVVSAVPHVQGFFWLVGEVELRDGSVRPGEASADQYIQRSTVHIKKCRYLEEVGISVLLGPCSSCRAEMGLGM